MLRLMFLASLILGIFSDNQADNLKSVSDETLLNLIKTEQYVVVLFTVDDAAKNKCQTCEQFENALLSAKEELVESLSALVVKVVNSQLLRLYSPLKEPALVFFRHGIPLLYNDRINSYEIVQMLTENNEPTVKELTDSTFEHLTQASSGATTGDWFVMFYSTDCVECVRMFARWEGVGAKLKQRVNVARIDIHTNGVSTARRFNVYGAPEFIFFRHGKMYRYQFSRDNIEPFVSFAKDWYKNARAEKVPVPQSPFDDFVQTIADVLLDNPWIMKLGSITIGVFIIISIASKFRRKSESTPQKTD